MERERKLELIQRSLGLRHKIKVHESMKAPETHEDLSVMMLAKWELEDELAAIDQMLGESRAENVAEKRRVLLRHGPKKSSYLEAAPTDDEDDEPKKPSGKKK
jgi:hypothetical protein